MGSIRMYTGDDGATHIEEIDPSEHPAWSELHDATKIVFRAQQPASSATGTSPRAASTSSPSPARLRSA